MKYTALSLLVIGVASVNAGTVTTSSSSSGSGSASLNNYGAIGTTLLASGQAKQVGAAMNGW